MSLTVQQERFSLFAGAVIDVCNGCGEDITSADGSCVRLELTPQPAGRLHTDCFAQMLAYLRLFEAFVLRSAPSSDAIH